MNSSKSLIFWSGSFKCIKKDCSCLAKAFVRQGCQLEDVIKIQVEIHNIRNQEKLRSKNQRITVPNRIRYAQEILAEGLSNSFSNNLIHNQLNDNESIAIT